MDLITAIQLKKELVASLLSRRRKIRTVSFAFSPRVITIKSLKEAIAPVVNGVGISERTNGESFIKILTREKPPVTKTTLAKYYGVEKENLIIENVGRISFKSPMRQHRPPFPGISVGHYKVTAGTLGCFVQDKDGKIYVLSNNHVLGNSDRGKWEDPILQPGRLDGGSRRKDIIARLSHIVPLSRAKANNMDAAIAVVDNDLNPDYRISQRKRVNETVIPTNKMKVEKWGRTTGHTTGFISSRNVDFQIDFDGNLLEFHDQFEIQSRSEMFCDDGDSGSLILERGGFNAVGLLFAGTEGGTAYASPINDILSAFSVKIL